MLRIAFAGALTSCIVTASALPAATLIDGSTTGLYNSGIGTVLDGTNPFGGNFMFPLANSSGGDPNLTIPAGSPPDLSAAAASLGGFLTTPAAPGGTWSAGPVAIPSSWAINDETAVIYTLNAGVGNVLKNVTASFGMDNGIFVWLNGVFLGGQLNPGGVFAGEFTLDLGTLSGLNYLQVLREDHGGLAGYSVLVSGDIAPIPLPAAGLLLLASLGGLAAVRRRTA